MSTQPTELPELPELPELQNQETQPVSLLDGPWKVTILPDEPEVPTAPTQVKIGPNGELLQWLPAPDPHAVKSQPWRRGDVARLKDDSPRGMMEYIATHTNGWWQELAERALRDNEKAERQVREAGWQPGQCWALEVDAEAKQKLLDAEEAKRQREEAERAKEAAEKEEFLQRQMELLKKAGRAPRCEYLYTDGRGCRAPQVKGERWCHGHAKAMSYRPEKLEMEMMEDEQAVMVNLYRVTRSLLAGRISEKTAGLMLWSVAIGMPGARRSRSRKTYHGDTEARRKGKSLPRIHADDRGSEKQLAKPKTFETQRNGGSRGGEKVSRELGKSRGIARNRNVIARDRKPKSDTKTFETQRNGGSRGRACHAGVTRRKSFKSGVRQGSRGNQDRRNRRDRNVIARDRKGKGLPLIHADKRGSENGQQSGARCQKQGLHSSASPCLRGRFHALQNGQAGL